MPTQRVNADTDRSREAETTAEERRPTVYVETVGAATGTGGTQLDSASHEGYWRRNYPSRPYYSPDIPFDTFAAAYRHGWESRARNPERSFADREMDLRAEWERSEGGRHLTWEQARPAISDAWDQTDVNLLGES